MAQTTAQSEPTPRSVRVRRGFNRLAILGSTLGLATALAFIVFAAARSDNGTVAQIKTECQSVPDHASQARGVSPNTKYAAFEADPLQVYFDRASQGAQKRDAQGSLAMAALSAALGLFWAGLTLVLSWLIRGFME